MLRGSLKTCVVSTVTPEFLGCVWAPWVHQRVPPGPHAAARAPAELPEGLPPSAFSLTALAWHFPCGQSGPNPLQTRLGAGGRSRSWDICCYRMSRDSSNRSDQAMLLFSPTRGGSVPQGPREGKGTGWRRNPEVLRRRTPRLSLSWLGFAGLHCLWSCVSPRNTGASGLQVGFGLC